MDGAGLGDIDDGVRCLGPRADGKPRMEVDQTQFRGARVLVGRGRQIAPIGRAREVQVVRVGGAM